MPFFPWIRHGMVTEQLNNRKSTSVNEEIFLGKSPSLLVDRVWLVRTTPTLLRPFAHHLVGKVVIQAADLLITISTTQVVYRISGTGWRLNQPIWKICSSKWVHLPQFSGWKFQNLTEPILPAQFIPIPRRIPKPSEFKTKTPKVYSLNIPHHMPEKITLRYLLVHIYSYTKPSNIQKKYPTFSGTEVAIVGKLQLTPRHRRLHIP